MKKLEWLAKNLLAVVVALLGWRPGRRARAVTRLEALRAAGRGRVLLVRPDNRVGEALLTTPAVDALASRGFEVHVLVHAKVKRVLVGHPNVAKLWVDEQRVSLVRALRAERFDVVVNCGNWAAESVTSAVLSRLVAPSSVVLGPANFPAGWLADVAVAPRADSRAEGAQRAHLASPLTGELPLPARLTFRPTAPFAATPTGKFAVVNPGGRLGYRRVSPALFAAAARTLVAAGVTPLVTWGPGEEALAAEVLREAPGAVLAPPTNLDELAALMRAAVVTVCNNTGPMHLAVSVGCPTVALFLHMELARWGHAFAPHHMVDLTPVAETERAALVARVLTEALR